MSMFENLLKDEWIQVYDDENTITIEYFNFKDGITKEKIGDHCITCVAVNYCWFKNEEGKKPKPMEYSEMNIFNLSLKGQSQGLYHPNCHCKEYKIPSPTPENIKLIIPAGKDWWTLTDKKNWIKSWGYQPNHEFIKMLEQYIKEAYIKGNYEIWEIGKYGVRANFFISLPGKNEKANKIYKIKAGMSIFPNGTLKCNTYIGGKL